MNVDLIELLLNLNSLNQRQIEMLAERLVQDFPATADRLETAIGFQFQTVEVL
jgi:hypothetical protein